MDFNFSEEQQLLGDTVQRFMREHYTFEKRKEIMKSKEGWDRDTWNELTGLGLTAINVPEEHGGLSGGPVETMLVMNAIGQGLLLEPYLSTAVFAPALLKHLNSPAVSSELLPLIASGERIVVVAHQEAQARGEVIDVKVRAEKSGDGYVIDGLKSVIVHATAADEFLVSARTSGNPRDRAGISVFRIDAKASGVVLRPYITFDAQRAAEVHFNQVRVPGSALVGVEGQAADALEHAHDVVISAICSEAVGVMRSLIDATIDYTKNRKQFGQPIGKFQALQHRMADMAVQLEQAKSMSYLAAIKCQSDDATDRRKAISAAKVIIGQAGRFIAQNAIQLHGGMGMTDELIVSHHFKRLTAIDLSFGDADHHMEKFIAASAA